MNLTPEEHRRIWPETRVLIDHLLEQGIEPAEAGAMAFVELPLKAYSVDRYQMRSTRPEPTTLSAPQPSLFGLDQYLSWSGGREPDPLDGLESWRPVQEYVPVHLGWSASMFDRPVMYVSPRQYEQIVSAFRGVEPRMSVVDETLPHVSEVNEATRTITIRPAPTRSGEIQLAGMEQAAIGRRYEQPVFLGRPWQGNEESRRQLDRARPKRRLDGRRMR
jgi:hypothetical protein